VRCPTLVTHTREDGRVPFEQGLALAGLIPGAQFVPLESRNHLLLESEPAWRQFVEAFDAFLLTAQPEQADVAVLDGLTARENEVLERVAQGLDNAAIASHLGISEKTVRNQVSIIFSKLGVNSRAQAIVRARDAGFGRRT
jgi:DNA-binding NarL/FixJ family response regulator